MEKKDTYLVSLLHPQHENNKERSKSGLRSIPRMTNLSPFLFRSSSFSTSMSSLSSLLSLFQMCHLLLSFSSFRSTHAQIMNLSCNPIDLTLALLVLSPLTFFINNDVLAMKLSKNHYTRSWTCLS